MDHKRISTPLDVHAELKAYADEHEQTITWALRKAVAALRGESPDDNTPKPAPAPQDPEQPVELPAETAPPVTADWNEEALRAKLARKSGGT
jgi:hypothetical protein